MSTQEQIDITEEFIEIYECGIDAMAGLRDPKECEEL